MKHATTHYLLKKEGFLGKASPFAVVAALAGAFAPAGAAAQSAVDVLRDEILVTATKKSSAENVQDVPLAVTAYGSDQLDALQFRDLSNLTYVMPNVQLDDIGTAPGIANFSIRGLGINSSIPSIDPTVGVFMDGMYLGVNQGVVFDMFDIESIEVLRGPQGILFGRNVTGGAVVVNTKDAPDEFEASFKTAVESGLRSTGNNYFAMGSVGGPIIEDRLNGKIAAYYNNDQGWFSRYLGGPQPAATAEALAPVLSAIAGFPPDQLLAAVTQNPNPDRVENFGASETVLIRPSLLFKATDNLEFNLKYEYGSSDGDGPAAQNHTAGNGSTNPFFSADRNTFDFAIDEPGFYDSEWHNVILETNWDVAFGDGTITNIFSWRDFTAETLGDIDATPLFIFHSGTRLEQDQISNELRYAGRFFDKLDVTTGVFYFTQDIAYDENRITLGGLDNFFGGGIQDQQTLGVFANLDYDLTDRLTLTVGARYTYEEKEADIANIVRTGECSAIAGTCNFDFQDEDSWENFNPKIGLTWRANDYTNIYGHWTQAVRSGGFNLRSAAAEAAQILPGGAPNPDFDPAFAPGPFDEETVNAFEIGAKVQPGGGKAIINAAVYVNDINNMQREINLAQPGALIIQVVNNTADATIWGFEMDTQIAFTDNFLFTGFLGYANGEYDEILFDISSDGVLDQNDFNLEIPRLSPFSYGAGFVYSQDLGDLGTGNLRFNYSHRDQNFFTDNNLGFFNEVDIIDAAAEWRPFDETLAVRVYGRNLLNEVNFGGDSQLPGSVGGGTFSPLTRGRTVGLELQLDFN